MSIERIKTRNTKQANKILIEYAFRTGIPLNLMSEVRTLTISDVNDENTVKTIRSEGLDILFVWGIPILKPNTIKAVRYLVLNAYTSLLPMYKGSQVEFWMFYKHEFDYAGITFHKVDAGVDTGDIIFQIRAENIDLINPEVLRASNSIRVIKYLPDLLKKIYAGKHSFIPQDNSLPLSTYTYNFSDIKLEYLIKVYLDSHE